MSHVSMSSSMPGSMSSAGADPQQGRHRGPRGRTGTTPAPGARIGKHRAEPERSNTGRALATATLAAGLLAGPALTGPASADSYTVQSGDTLNSIAQAHCTTWRALYDNNRDVVSSPTTIYPGQTLQTGGGSRPTAPAANSGGSTVPSGAFGQDLLAEARQLAGVPYAYGGDTPSGFDCSGFTSYVHAQAGKTIPRTSAAQAAAATPVSGDNLRPGDLIFYSPGGSVSHVAIYAGDGMVWEAPGSGGQVQRAPVWDVARSYGRF